MEKKYLHIGFNWNGKPKTDEIQRLIEIPGNAENWMKYGGNCWIVYTEHDQKAWADYLQKHISPEDSIIILEIANISETNGWLPPGLWEWFSRVRH